MKNGGQGLHMDAVDHIDNDDLGRKTFLHFQPSNFSWPQLFY